MELKSSNSIIYIDDNSPEAVAIRDGAKWKVDKEGKIIIGKKRTIAELVDEAENIEDIKALLRLIIKKVN